MGLYQKVSVRQILHIKILRSLKKPLIVSKEVFEGKGQQGSRRVMFWAGIMALSW